jgi:hypothetical protein
MALRWTIVALSALLWTLCASAPATSADLSVDLELVLAVDVSRSMDREEQELQRQGYVQAFRDPAVIKAIQAGPTGRIAVVYFEWAGSSRQQIVVPWMLIDGPAAAEQFAAMLERQPIGFLPMTSISSALQFAHRALGDNPYRGLRRVVDVSGDGPNNSGPPVAPERDKLLADGIVINGLPIILRPSSSGFFDLSRLDEYYKECVIGGPGSFVIPIREKSEFAAATRQKLILEISGLMIAPRIVPVQASPPAPPIDCMIGERLWQRYYDGVIRN